MEKTSMNHLAEELDHYLTLDITPEAKTIIKIIKERVEGRISKEREQIEQAYNSGKNYPDADGSKYYFMNYISND